MTNILYPTYRNIQHYFLLREKEKRAKVGDCPKIRRMQRIMNSPLPADAMPLARQLGDLIGRLEDAYERDLAISTSASYCN